MNKALEAYIAATTEEEIRAAYQAMLEHSDAPEGSEPDDVEAMLQRMGHPQVGDRLNAIWTAEANRA